MIEIDILPASTESKGADSILIRFGSFNYEGNANDQKIILIDGGYADNADAIIKKVKNIYRSDLIDCVICSHPDADHINGLIELVNRKELRINHVCVNNPWNFAYEISRKIIDDRTSANSVKTRLDKSLDALDTFLELVGKHIEGKVWNALAGTTIFDAIKIIGPTKDYYAELVKQFPGMHEERKVNSTSVMVEVPYASDKGHFLTDPITSARNDSSTILLLDYEGFRVLFTGDAGVEGMNKAISFAESEGINISNLDYMQMPHHGSLKNANADIYSKFNPKQLFVSAPESSDKHPSKLLLNYFCLANKNKRVYHVSKQCLIISNKSPGRPNASAAKVVEKSEIIHLPEEYKASYCK